MNIQSALRRASAILEPLGRFRITADQEATADTLTGLANRRQFLRHANAAIAQAGRRSQLCAVLLIGLDRFRTVNDDFGHDAGDSVLIAIAQRLGQVLPTSWIAGRLGGDEFAVLLGPDDDLKIEYCAEQIGARIARPIAHAGRDIRVEPNIGMAMAPDDGMTAAALLAVAEERLSFRKRGRRKRAIGAAA